MLAEIKTAHRLRKKERLSSEKIISELFEKGNRIKAGCLQIVYFKFTDESAPPAQVLITVPKRLFRHSVTRNLLKRRIREAYRLHKSPLLTALTRQHINLYTAIIYTGQEVYEYTLIEESWVQGVIKLLDIIEANAK
jgi:ribonuclease P protein component